jgi:hypothetical protein
VTSVTPIRVFQLRRNSDRLAVWLRGELGLDVGEATDRQLAGSLPEDLRQRGEGRPIAEPLDWAGVQRVLGHEFRAVQTVGLVSIPPDPVGQGLGLVTIPRGTVAEAARVVVDRRGEVELISLESAVSVFVAEFVATETASAALYEVEVVRPR